MLLYPPILFDRKDGTRGAKLSPEGKAYILGFVKNQWPHCRTPGEIPLPTRHRWLEETGIPYTTLTALLVNTMKKRNTAAQTHGSSDVAGPSGVQLGHSVPASIPLPSPASATFNRQESSPFETKPELGVLAKFKAKEDILFRSFTIGQKNELHALFEVDPDVKDSEARYWGPPLGLTEEQSLQWVRVRRSCSLNQSPAPQSRPTSTSISPSFVKRELSADALRDRSRPSVPLFHQDTTGEDVEIDDLSDEEIDDDLVPARSALPTPSATISPDPLVMHNFEGTSSPRDILWDGTVFGDGEHREGSLGDSTRSMTISPVLNPVALHEDRVTSLLSSLESAQSYANAMANPSSAVNQKPSGSDTLPLMDMLRDLKSTEDLDMKDDEPMASIPAQSFVGPSPAFNGAFASAPGLNTNLPSQWPSSTGLGAAPRRASLDSDGRTNTHSGPHRTQSESRNPSRARPYPPPAIDTFQSRINPVSPVLTSGSSWTTLNSPPPSASSSPSTLHPPGLTAAQRMRLAITRAAKNKDTKAAEVVDEEALRRRPEEIKRATELLRQCATSSRSATPMQSPM